ncbi:CsiV family protein [Parahaliea mediterranea]|uniref:Peptidoglycan-binding protein CsiV n=1 Tax=Parahaliea mediterranea TaxID=651086 RepID=A0A939DI09_9GAMM|nr:CsiV family protein [Parahaliea mediterranea]MBN7798388.1 hypothetical protein [Parahaliea mediterranea]
MKPLNAIAALTTVLALGPATATADNWYRVELLVFGQGGSAAASQERWDPEPTLSYPDRQRFLVYPERVARRLAEHPGATSEVDALGRQVITLPARELPSPDVSTPGDSTPGDSTPGDSTPDESTPDEFTFGEDIPRRGESAREATAGEPLDPNAMAAIEEAAPPALPEPFVARPIDELQYRGKAAYMERHGPYRVLFHQSWVQPVASESRALPIVLDDSGANGAWPELQGSVKLYAARYLHIETDLWLNTDGNYLPDYWHMPPPPLGPASVVIEEPPLPEGFAAVSGDGFDTPVPFADDAAGDPETRGENTEDTQAGPAYPYRHAVRLAQSRRMRSAEVHYIDHPMLGVVVKLTPLDEEALRELAAADAERAEAEAESADDGAQE